MLGSFRAAISASRKYATLCIAHSRGCPSKSFFCVTSCFHDVDRHVAAAGGLDKANSGGELPYHFADTSSKLQPAADSNHKHRHTPTLQPIDDDSVFDGIADVAISISERPHQKAAEHAAGNPQLDLEEEEELLPVDDDHLANTRNGMNGHTHSVKHAGANVEQLSAESPASSWSPAQVEASAPDSLPSNSVPSQSEDYSWSADLLGRLNLNSASPGGASDGFSHRQSDQQPATPSSAGAIGSAPSTTLSEFSTNGRNTSSRNANRDESLRRGSANRGNRSEDRSRRGYNSNRYKFEPTIADLSCICLSCSSHFADCRL